MCGICGFLTKNSISIDQLTTMNDSMIHRGPNDSGVEIKEVHGKGARRAYYLGLAHRRLSIQDLSPRGHQPMHSLDGRISLVFNGEIYNYKELRRELDYPFASDSDTEVIIAAYLKWGIDCVRHFNGMFAIALYDHDEGKLYLIKDRLGVKPLYYWESDNGIVYASELKSIMMHPLFHESINYDTLTRYFVKKYILSPDTIFENVHKLEPGTWLEFDGKTIRKNTYWDSYSIYRMPTETSDDVKNIELSSFDSSKKALKDALERAIAYRMIADVPIGLFRQVDMTHRLFQLLRKVYQISRLEHIQ